MARTRMLHCHECGLSRRMRVVVRLVRAEDWAPDVPTRVLMCPLRRACAYLDEIEVVDSYARKAKP